MESSLPESFPIGHWLHGLMDPSTSRKKKKVVEVTIHDDIVIDDDDDDDDRPLIIKEEPRFDGYGGGSGRSQPRQLGKENLNRIKRKLIEADGSAEDDKDERLAVPLTASAKKRVTKSSFDRSRKSGNGGGDDDDVEDIGSSPILTLPKSLKRSMNKSYGAGDPIAFSLNNSAAAASGNGSSTTTTKDPMLSSVARNDDEETNDHDNAEEEEEEVVESQMLTSMEQPYSYGCETQQPWMNADDFFTRNDDGQRRKVRNQEL